MVNLVKPEDVVCLDVEAAGIMSYPIEVGLAALDGTSWSLLIKPDPDWLADETLWSHVSASVHGISQADLIRDGVPVQVVALALNERLAGKLVLSDNPGLDANWLGTLHGAAEAQAKWQQIVDAIKEIRAAAKGLPVASEDWDSLELTGGAFLAPTTELREALVVVLERGGLSEAAVAVANDLLERMGSLLSRGLDADF